MKSHSLCFSTLNNSPRSWPQTNYIWNKPQIKFSSSWQVLIDCGLFYFILFFCNEVMCLISLFSAISRQPSPCQYPAAHSGLVRISLQYFSLSLSMQIRHNTCAPLLSWHVQKPWCNDPLHVPSGSALVSLATPLLKRYGLVSKSFLRLSQEYLLPDQQDKHLL